MLTRWTTNEPLRLYLYGLLGPVLGLLILYGLLTAEQAAAWGLLLAAVLVPTVEAARARVTPTTSAKQAARRPGTS